MPEFWRKRFFFVLIALVFASGTVCAADTVEQLGDASIVHDVQAGRYTLGAAGATLTLALSAQQDFMIATLLSPSGRNWSVTPQAGSVVTVNGSALPFGSRPHGFQFEKVSTSNDGHLLRLDAVFLLRSSNLRVTRHFVVTDGSPSFEVWTTFQAAGGDAVVVSDLNAFQLTVPSGAVHWLTGRQGDPGDEVRDTAFQRRQQALADGETFTLGSGGRSSEQAVPWLAVEGEQDQFYAGLMWSGPWSLVANRRAAGIGLSWGLAPMATTVRSGTVEGPHAIFGVARGTLSDATAALRSYVLNGIRKGRPLIPLVTYNTWFTNGTRIDESLMREAIERAAGLGAELFVVDAGWYTGADLGDSTNFDQGLGSWEVDPGRFPNGMRALTDYAHSRGMKFGIWVEPERVNLSQVGNGGVDEQWLASSGDSYGSDHAAQICLAGAAGRQWVLDRLTSLIDEVQPDYLKWDNNMWTNCDREGHDHGWSDGPFAHVTALYQVFETLRQQYPDLMIENCSGGGNRIDFGLLRYTETGWMDDRTAPSAHVRHNIQGLSAVFPPAYLLSFVTDDGVETLRGGPDLALYFRSRMSGALGLSFWIYQFSETEIANIVREISIYKGMRTTLSVAAAALLSPQVGQTEAPEWDVIQASSPGSDALLIYAYQNALGAEKVNVRPTGLKPDSTYAVSSVDVGFLGSATGTDIMAYGIDVVASPLSAAHILRLFAEN
jgi:alpha-galactosidase